MTRGPVFIILLLVSAGLYAADNNSFRDKEIKFITWLYSNGRYFDCIAETEKLGPPGNPFHREYFIYTNYFLAGQFDTVLSNYKGDNSSVENGFLSSLLLSESFLNKGLYYDSYRALKKYEYNELPEKYIFTMLVRRVEPLILSGDFKAVDIELAGSSGFLKDSAEYNLLSGELLQYKERGLKSPPLSALMSAIIPGLGQCYSGYPGEGLISLLAIAGTVYGGYYTRQRGMKGFSYTLFGFSGLFYGGNIYGAYNSAARADENIQREWYREIISRHGSYNPGVYIDFVRAFQ